jgi:hypothetical protein
MERSNFIRLLEEYKSKAIQELHKESKVQASLLISNEFKQAIVELESACKTVNVGLEAVSKEVEKITSQNALSYSGYFSYSTASTVIMESVIGCISHKIRNNTAFRQKENEIRNKFDATIKAAKASRSTIKLKELADALGIETPEITVDTGVRAQIDTEFVKEKIKAVQLLK